MQRQTTNAKPTTVTRKWYIIDATDLILGRLASEVALTLMGKNKPEYTPNVDGGDYVIIINAAKVGLSGNKRSTKLTGHKASSKNYYNHSRYLGNLRVRTSGEMVQKYPVEMLERAVWGMIPKGRLGRQIYKKLFVYEGSDHKHEAQKPEALQLRYIGGNK